LNTYDESWIREPSKLRPSMHKWLGLVACDELEPTSLYHMQSRKGASEAGGGEYGFRPGICRAKRPGASSVGDVKSVKAELSSFIFRRVDLYEAGVNGGLHLVDNTVRSTTGEGR